MNENKIELDATNWKSIEDFYTSYSNATYTPKWFGRNLDAFHDTLRGGICKITPEKIIIRNIRPHIKKYKFIEDITEICKEEDVECEVYLYEED